MPRNRQAGKPAPQIPESQRPARALQRCNAATIQRCNAATLQRFNDSTIQRFNDSTIQRFNDSTIQPFNDSTVQRLPRRAVAPPMRHFAQTHEPNGAAWTKCDRHWRRDAPPSQTTNAAQIPAVYGETRFRAAGLKNPFTNGSLPAFSFRPRIETPWALTNRLNKKTSGTQS